MKRYIFLVGALAISIYTFSQTLKTITGTPPVSFRGLCVVSDQVIWMSGAKGTVGKSLDGGHTWKYIHIKDHEAFDFRDIEAFDSLNAVVMGAGSPAHFLYTTDGGDTWTISYTNTRSEIFFDGMAFWDNRRGMAFSDPVNGKIFLVETYDGGRTWKPIPEHILPMVSDSEAGFAASGSSIRCLPGGNLILGTGGKSAHIYIGNNYGRSWSRKTTEITQGNSASGVFSLAFLNINTGIIVGGNYQSDSLSTNNCLLTKNGGGIWKKPNTAPQGYISCIQNISGKKWICAGTQGIFTSADHGQNWKKIGAESFHVIGVSPSGKTIVFAGTKGKAAILVSP